MRSRNTQLTKLRRDVLKCSTQQELADLTRLHKQTIMKLETGGKPNIYTLKVLQKTLRKHGLFEEPSIVDLF